MFNYCTEPVPTPEHVLLKMFNFIAALFGVEVVTDCYGTYRFAREFIRDHRRVGLPRPGSAPQRMPDMCERRIRFNVTEIKFFA